MSKHLSNSLILKINHELNSIVMNKGRIHGELMYFEVLFKIRSNQTMNLGEKLGILIDLRRELNDESTE